MSSPPCGAYVRVMGWIIAGIVAGILLFAVYAVITLRMAALGAAMGAAQTPPARWSALGLWLTLIMVPAWGPIVWLINRLGYRVPVLGAPFALGGSRRQARMRAVRRR